MAPRSPRQIQPRRRRQPDGFSLLELLLGAIISVVVLVGAVRALLALTGSDAGSQQELNRKDAMTLVLGLMQDEISKARRVETGGSLSSLSSALCPTTPLLILRGATSNEDISYGRLDVSSGNTTWRGPGVLMRCGRPYKSDRTIDTSASLSERGVIDNLTATGFTATSLGGSGKISRNVQISLVSNASTDNNISRTPLTSTIQVPINTNPLYGANANNTTCGSAGCQDADGYRVHYQPTLGGSSITASGDKENIFYFPNNYYKPDNTPAYTLSRSPGSGTCTAEQCSVRDGTTGQSVTFFNGSVLVFNDIDIRL